MKRAFRPHVGADSPAPALEAHLRNCALLGLLANALAGCGGSSTTLIEQVEVKVYLAKRWVGCIADEPPTPSRLTSPRGMLASWKECADPAPRMFMGVIRATPARRSAP